VGAKAPDELLKYIKGENHIFVLAWKARSHGFVARTWSLSQSWKRFFQNICALAFFQTNASSNYL